MEQVLDGTVGNVGEEVGLAIYLQEFNIPVRMTHKCITLGRPGKQLFKKWF